MSFRAVVASGEAATSARSMTPMTMFYVDVSSAQAGMSLAGAVAVCAKVTQGAGYLNPCYPEFKGQAAAGRALFFGYHFLEEQFTAAQAAWCRQHAGPVPIMVDCEPAELAPGVWSSPTLADLLGFIDAYRHLGGVCNLAYLPRWVWSSWGSPSLAPLTRRRMSLVSSDYCPYSDTGPGWEPYGGIRPAVWQYTESAVMNGRLVDRNAFKGTRAQLELLVTTGSTRRPEPPADEEDDHMMLESGAGAETIITFTKGSRSWIAFGCDASRTRRPAPRLRVAVFSASRGWSQREDVEMPVSGKAAVDFQARDVAMISVVREAGNAGDDVPVGYNLG